MMYTVGRRDIYEKYLLEDPNPRKLGRVSKENIDNYTGEDYGGGSIWRRLTDAMAYLSTNNMNDYSVYGVECGDEEVDWVIPDYGYLLVTSRLVSLCKEFTVE